MNCIFFNATIKQTIKVGQNKPCYTVLQAHQLRVPDQFRYQTARDDVLPEKKKLLSEQLGETIEPTTRQLTLLESNVQVDFQVRSTKDLSMEVLDDN